MPDIKVLKHNTEKVANKTNR